MAVIGEVKTYLGRSFTKPTRNVPQRNRDLALAESYELDMWADAFPYYVNDQQMARVVREADRRGFKLANPKGQ